jgi:hypothetical protein
MAASFHIPSRLLFVDHPTIRRYVVRGTVGLSWVELSWVELSWVELSWVELSWAERSWADLSWADLSWAELWAELSSAELSWAELSWAELSWVDVMTDGQSAYPSWCRAPLWDSWPDFSFSFLLPDNCFALRLGAPSLTLLFHLRLLSSLFIASYDSQGLRWKYSNPPPHARHKHYCR